MFFFFYFWLGITLLVDYFQTVRTILLLCFFFLPLVIPLFSFLWLSLRSFFYFVGYFVHFQTSYYPSFRDHIMGIFVVTPWKHFPILLWSLWGCADLYIVGHSPCSILSVLEIIFGIQANDTFLLLSMRLGFFPSYVNKILVYSYYGLFLFLGSSALGLIFPLSSIRVCFLRVGIYSVAEPIYFFTFSVSTLTCFQFWFLR